MSRCLSLLTVALLALPLAAQDPAPGYDDTPLLPDSKYRVHDRTRPRPPVVTPPPSGPFTPAPSDAIVLFDGKDLSHFRGGKGEAGWRLVEGAMEVNGSGDLTTKASFGDGHLHLEWRAPEVVQSSSQGRGNSGVFLMERYEVQILDSYENPSYADGQAAALYGQQPPLVNACRPPGTWQVYDIIFRAPRFEGDRCVAPARVTVVHNGVVVQADQAFLGATRHKTLPSYAPHAAKLPFRLQDHGNPVRYRNIWFRPL